MPSKMLGEALPRTRTLHERDIMLITDCPLDVEIKKRLAHSSQSASMMFQALNKAGIRRNDVHVSYLCTFRPHKGNLHETFWKKGDTASEFIAWKQGSNVRIHNSLIAELEALRHEIHMTQPKLLILSGKWALYFMTGETTVTETTKSNYGALLKWRASHLQLTKWWNYPSIHIAMPILGAASKWKLPTKQQVILQDFNRLGRLATYPRVAAEAELEPSDFFKQIQAGASNT